MKHYRLAPHEIRPLVGAELGRCVVSNQILAEGHPVGYCYRDHPEDEEDSGWRFFGGHESAAYIDNPKHFSIVPVNVVTNDDAAIPSLLGAEPDDLVVDIFGGSNTTNR